MMEILFLLISETEVYVEVVAYWHGYYQRHHTIKMWHPGKERFLVIFYFLNKNTVLHTSQIISCFCISRYIIYAMYGYVQL
jgi:hypothetical protein